MNKINWFWQCEFIDGDGKSVWKMLSASTPLGAKKQAFETSRRLNITPKYDTIRVATDAEIKAFKKMIKNRIKEK